MNEATLQLIQEHFVKSGFASSDKPFYEWPYVSPGNTYYYKIFYNSNPEVGLGFDFVCVSDEGGIDNGKEPYHWTPDRMFAEVTFHGTACFDGVRHLYWGHEASDNEGYFYYPNLRNLHYPLAALRALEEKYCREHKK